MKSNFKVLFASNQGGEPVVKLNGSIAQSLLDIANVEIYASVMTNKDKEFNDSFFKIFDSVYSYEEHIKHNWNVDEKLEYLTTQYPDINWSLVVASERSFTDYSYLEHASGHRLESFDYIIKLLINIVSYYELVLDKIEPDIIIAQTPDTIFTHILYLLANHKNIKIYGIAPAWITVSKNSSGMSYLTNTANYESSIMKQKYEQLKSAEPNSDEVAVAESIMEKISCYDVNKAYKKINNKSFANKPYSPNIKKIFKYSYEQYKKDSMVYFNKINILRKIKGNILRIYRFTRLKYFLKRIDNTIPKKSIFFPMHFQPEHSTLVNGPFYLDQIATIENISKSIPIGYTLVVKEHPGGRGVRSISQYKRISSLYNVKIVDLPSKDILQKVELAITISGTVAIEALVFKKPIIVLGKSFFSFADDLICSIDNIKELYQNIYEILILKKHTVLRDTDSKTINFFVAYSSALIDAYPKAENSKVFANYIKKNILGE